MAPAFVFLFWGFHFMKQHNLAAALAAALSLSFASVSAFAETPDANQFIVTYKDDGGDAVRAAVRAAGGQLVKELGPQKAFAAKLPGNAAEALRHNPNVAFVEVDAPRYALGQVTPYGITNVQAPQTVATGADGTGIKVCVIDSGIKADHEDFDGIAM